MDRPRVGIGATGSVGLIAAAMLAATLPYVATAAVQAAPLAALDRSGGGASPSRVQPRLLSAPTTAWAVLATFKGMNILGQPAVLGPRNGTYGDDSVLVPVRPGANQAALMSFSPTLTPSSQISVSNSFNPGEFTLAQGDDTIWMTVDNWSNESQYAAINGRTGTIAGPYAGPNIPKRTTNSVAPSTVGPPRHLQGLTSKDDTVYIAYEADTFCPNSGGIIAVPVGSPGQDDTLIPETTPFRAGQLTRSLLDDTLFLASTNANATSGGSCSNQPTQDQVVSPRLGTSQTLSMPWYSWGAAQGYSHVYLGEAKGNGVGRVNPRNLDDSTFVDLQGQFGPQFYGLASWVGNASSDDTLFLADLGNDAVWIVNGGTLVADDSVTMGPDSDPRYVAVARPDLAYATSYANGGAVWALGVVSGTSPTTTGSPDDSITINLTLPELFTQDDSLVTNVWLDDSVTTKSALVRNGNTIQAKVPAGTGGPYSILVGLNGGNKIKVGEFTYGSPAPPTPPNPPAPAPAMSPTAQVINGTVGVGISPTSQFTLSNFTMPVTYTIYPPLPSGLTLNSSTGVVSGTPTTTYSTTRHWITAGTAGNSESAYSILDVTVVTPSTPTPVPVPSELAPGESALQIDGVLKPVRVDPKPTDQGLSVDGDGWTMELDGLDPEGQPLNLGPNGVLLLQCERDVMTSGTGFRPNSTVELYVDPPVQPRTGSATSLKTGVAPVSSAIYIGTAPVNEQGTFRGVATLPATIKPGDHILQAVGLSPSGQIRALSLGVRVEPSLVLDQGERVKGKGRIHDRINTTGSSTGIDAGTRLTPYIKYSGQKSFTKGRATIVVASDGTFQWTRQIRRDKGVTGYVAYVEVTSNQVTWVKLK